MAGMTEDPITYSGDILHARRWRVILGLTLLTILILTGMPFIGMTYIPFRALFNPTGIQAESNILWQFRIPRVLVAFCAGAGLGLSGMAFQAMFRNPLATPFTLGVSSGASLGAATYVWLGFTFGFLGISGMTLFAFLGAMLTILIVWGLTQLRGSFSTTTM